MGVKLVRATVAGKVLEGKHILYRSCRLLNVTGADAHVQMLFNDY